MLSKQNWAEPFHIADMQTTAKQFTKWNVTRLICSLELFLCDVLNAAAVTDVQHPSLTDQRNKINDNLVKYLDFILVKLVQEGLSGAIKSLTNFQRAGAKGTKNLLMEQNVVK